MASINTNYGASIALQNLNKTNSELERTQNRINTGMKVSSAKDSGAIFAIATSQRANAASQDAVRAGGGVNHRLDLRSGVLIKDNHLAAVNGDIAVAVQRAQQLALPGTPIQVECDTLDQVDAALAAGADWILLDNMSLEMLAEAVRRCAGRATTEASGGVALDTVRRIAETGVDRISIGAITHSAPALDLALDFDGR
jgi:nicotinate-nucleotide pyrophosphorylase (carboxylating)